MAQSFTQIKTLYGQLSQNTTTTNTDLGGVLANVEQKYLLQKYYNNEGNFSTTTVGAQSLLATASLSLGAVSLTLTTAWLYHTTQTTVTFSNGDTRLVQFNRGSTAATWGVGLSAAATTALAVGGLQFYPTPPNYSKLKTVTISVGNLKWTPGEILTREQWDKMNVFPYYSNIPNNYYIYQNQLGIWPIPSTTGNTITYNYKFRIPDLSIEDYSTGTVAVLNGGTTVTGTSTVWTLTTNLQSESRYIKIAQTKGDNLWYQIQSIDSATSLTLAEPYQGIDVTGGTYVVGQMPILEEDFHDMLYLKPLVTYFSSTVDNPTKAKEFQDQYNMKLELLQEYSGNKTIHVDLRQSPMGQNPNLFQQNIG
jgi:hypothetical protein